MKESKITQKALNTTILCFHLTFPSSANIFWMQLVNTALEEGNKYFCMILAMAVNTLRLTCIKPEGLDWWYICWEPFPPTPWPHSVSNSSFNTIDIVLTPCRQLHWTPILCLIGGHHIMSNEEIASGWLWLWQQTLPLYYTSNQKD